MHLSKIQHGPLPQFCVIRNFILNYLWFREHRLSACGILRLDPLGPKLCPAWYAAQTLPTGSWGYRELSGALARLARLALFQKPEDKGFSSQTQGSLLYLSSGFHFVSTKTWSHLCYIIGEFAKHDFHPPLRFSEPNTQTHRLQKLRVSQFN